MWQSHNIQDKEKKAMDRETFEQQRAFAGEKKPSMLRRCVGHDYAKRQMYMITMVTEGRRKLFGEVVGRSEAPEGSVDSARMELSELGKKVEEEWWGIPTYYPQIKMVALQLMPDHLHGILFVKDRLPKPLGQVLSGFKAGCNRAYRSIFNLPVSYVVAKPQQTEQESKQENERQNKQENKLQNERERPPRTAYDRQHGLLFGAGYNDRLLLREGQLERWQAYLNDNPRRLLMKREHPDLFRVQRNLRVGDTTFSAIGNRFLLNRPVKLQVQCSRRLTDSEIAERTDFFLSQARQGAVLVSPAISNGEKTIMRAAFDAGLPLIFLQENGFSELAKPGGKRMEACADGRLLILAPWEHHNEKTTISRGQCLSLNDMAALICKA